jgi:hypothetical protein
MKLRVREEDEKEERKIMCTLTLKKRWDVNNNINKG